MAETDLISRQDAIDAVKRLLGDYEISRTVQTALHILPSARPEIVRCKDCIFHGLCRTSTRWAVAPKDDWYCADAERRIDEQTV